MASISTTSLSNGSLGIAKKLTNAYLYRINKEKTEIERSERIAIRAKALMSDPESSIWQSIIDGDPELKDLEAEPIELMNALFGNNIEANPKRQINPEIWARIAELCNLIGWQNGNWISEVEGLRYRNDGQEVKGYKSVEGPGVPNGLCVQAVDTPRGIRILNMLARVPIDK